MNNQLYFNWWLINYTHYECKICQMTSWYHAAHEPHRSRHAEANKEVLCTDPCNPTTGSVKVLCHWQFSGGYWRWTWALQGLSVKICAGCHNCITLSHPRPHPIPTTRGDKSAVQDLGYLQWLLWFLYEFSLPPSPFTLCDFPVNPVESFHFLGATIS